MRKTAYRAMTGMAAAAAFFLALSVQPGPALANQCQYSDNDNDNGPCVVVENNLTTTWFGNKEMHLWCYNGPPAEDHRIVLNPGDSYTCRGDSDHAISPRTKIKIKRHQVNCSDCITTYTCSGRKDVELTGNSTAEQITVSACDIVDE